MIRRKIFSVFLLIFFLWTAGCGFQRSNIIVPSSEDHQHRKQTIRSFDDKHYHAVMKYDANKGYLAIEFMDKNENKTRLFYGQKVRAIMALPKGEQRTFYLYNPHQLNFPAGSRAAKKALQHPPTDVVFAQKGWLKRIDHYKLTIWVTLWEKEYEIKYAYP
jgi:hypothetical protein